MCVFILFPATLCDHRHYIFAVSSLLSHEKKLLMAIFRVIKCNMGSYHKWEFLNGMDFQRNQLYVKAKPVQNG